MSGLPYQGGMNSYMFDYPQYGVSSGGGMSAVGSLASVIPYVGPFIGAAMNFAGAAYQNRAQERFFDEYMSPEARMSQMRAAGINPAAAAQGISGAPAPQMTAAGPSGAFTGLGEQIGNSVNTMLSADAIRSEIRNMDSRTTGQDIQNRFDNQTFDNRALYLKNQGLISTEQYKQASELSRQYPEMLSQSIEQIRSNIRKNDAQVKVFDQQIDNLKKEIGKMDEEIRKMKSDETLNYALAGEAGAREELERAEKALTDKKSELAEVEKRKAELGADSNTELKYREVEKSQGKEAADKWLDTQYDLVKRINEGVQDANVMTVEQRRIIESYDRRIADAEAYLDECSERYYKAGSFRKSWYKGELEAAQNKVDNLRKQKAEQLRRLNTNTSEGVHVFGIGGNRTR